jgi:hypothetical protein
MSDPLDTGVDFASRLVQNVYGLRKQEQDQGRAEAENARQATIRILEGTANSGSVNSEDMPKLYEHLLGLIGSKSKDVATFIPQVRAAFTRSNTPRKTMTIGPDVPMPASSMPSPLPGGGTEEFPAFQLPPVPQAGTVNTPAIRIMSPEEKGAAADRIAVARQKALAPGDEDAADKAAQRKLDLQRARFEEQQKISEARTAGHLQEITQRGTVKDLSTYNQPYYANVQSGMTPEDAKTEAAQYARNLMDAGLAVRQGQGNVSAAQVKYLKGHLADMQNRTVILSKRAETYAASVEQYGRLVAAGQKGAAVTRNLKAAETSNKALYAELSSLNREISKLETDVTSNGDLLLTDSQEIQDQITALKSRRDAVQDQISTVNKMWLPNMPEPTDGVLPPVPQMSNSPGNPRIVTVPRASLNAAKLQRVRSDNPTATDENGILLQDMSDDQLTQYLRRLGSGVNVWC